MTTRSRVAVLLTRPETVLQDYQRLFELAEGDKALRRGETAWGRLFQQYRQQGHLAR